MLYWRNILIRDDLINSSFFKNLGSHLKMKEKEIPHPNITLSKFPITIIFCLGLGALFISGCEVGTEDAGTASNCNNFELGCYNVDINSTNGACSDAYSCDANNETKPFCSISRAIQCVNNHTTPINAKIRIWAGSYAEQGLTLTASGKSTLQPISIEAKDGAQVDIIGDGSIEVLNLPANSNVHIQNLNFIGTGFKPLISLGDGVSPMNEIRLMSNTFTGVASWAVYAQAMTNSTFESNTISNAGNGLAIAGSLVDFYPLTGVLQSYGNWIKNNTFEEIGGKGLFYGYVMNSPLGARRGLVSDNIFRGVYISIDSWFDATDFLNNTFESSATIACATGIELNGRNGLVSGNTFVDCETPIKSRIETGQEISQGYVSAVDTNANSATFSNNFGPVADAVASHNFYGEYSGASIFRWGRCEDIIQIPTTQICRENNDCSAGESCAGVSVSQLTAWSLDPAVGNTANIQHDGSMTELAVGDFIEVIPYYHSITIENNQFLSTAYSAIVTTWKNGYLEFSANFDDWKIRNNSFLDVGSLIPGIHAHTSAIFLQRPGNTTVDNNTFENSRYHALTSRRPSMIGTPTLSITNNCILPSVSEDIRLEFNPDTQSNATVSILNNSFESGSSLPIGYENINTIGPVLSCPY